MPIVLKSNKESEENLNDIDNLDNMPVEEYKDFIYKSLKNNDSPTTSSKNIPKPNELSEMIEKFIAETMKNKQ